MKSLLISIYRVLPKPLKRAIVRVLFPTYTVAAKVYLTNPDGHFLVVKPVYHPGWDIPSGHVDKNESPDAAAVRELFEETGIKISTLEQRSVIFQPLCNTIQVIFSGTVDPTPSVKPDNVEISEARWVKRGEVNLLPHAMEALDVLCLLYTSPSPRDRTRSRMPSSA